MESEEMDGSVSRRKMLKTIGAGAAVAWTAPALVSVSQAGAQGFSSSCVGGICGDQEVCGANCGCLAAVEGQNFCHQSSFCSQLTACTATSQCPAGWACSASCCPGQVLCVPPCGTFAAGAGAGGKTTPA